MPRRKVLAILAAGVVLILTAAMATARGFHAPAHRAPAAKQAVTAHVPLATHGSSRVGALKDDSTTVGDQSDQGDQNDQGDSQTGDQGDQNDQGDSQTGDQGDQNDQGDSSDQGTSGSGD